MGSQSPAHTLLDWRTGLPTLTGRLVTLREPVAQDLVALSDLLSIGDACRFGSDEPLTDAGVGQFVDRVQRDRAAGLAFTFVVAVNTARAIAGLIQVRQLDPTFEGAEWEFVLTPAWRGTGAFIEAARLAGSFAFATVGVHRLEARVLQQNGRANGALRKLGAVQEGVLRRSVRRGDAFVDQVLWAVLKEDWSEPWAPAGPRVH